MRERGTVAAMRIDIYSDVICPWCFIGKRRLERALAERPGLEVAFHWRAFQLNPDMPPGGMDRKAYLSAKFGGAERGARVYQPVLTAAGGEGLGIDFDAIQRTPNTLLAHLLIRFAEPGAAQDRVVEALFDAYFRQGRDIGDKATLVAVAAEAGLDPRAVGEYLADEAELAAVRAEDQSARGMGVTGVPCFILEDRYALSGAQEPEALFAFFDLGREAAEAPAAGSD